MTAANGKFLRILRTNCVLETTNLVDPRDVARMRVMRVGMGVTMHTMTLCTSKKRALVGCPLALPLLAASSSAWAQWPGHVPAGLDPELANVFKGHNHYRYRHCAPYLSWTWQLANEAKRYAS